MQRYIVIFFLFLVQMTNAQFKTMTGKVLDESGMPVDGANVFLKSLDANSHLKKTKTIKGFFTFDTLSSDKYDIKISHIQFREFNDTIDIKKLSGFGEIILYPLSISLDEVIIKGEKPVFEQKIDRLIFNVDKSVSLTGASTLDAIKKLPSVKVNNSEEISLLGKGEVKIMLNGRLVQLSGNDLTNLLKSLPLNNIKQLELITTPPAKYDAEGNAGLINIVTKVNQNDGFNAELATSYTKKKYDAESLMGSFYYVKGKWNFNASISTERNIYYENINKNTYFLKQTWKNNYLGKNGPLNSVSGKFGVDYRIDKKQLIGISYLGFSQNGKNHNKDITNIFGKDKVDKDSTIHSLNQGSNKNYNHDVNVHYEFQSDSASSKISADIGYFTFKRSQDQDLYSQTYHANGTSLRDVRQISSATQKSNVYTVQVDVELPTNRLFDASLGGKLAFINTLSPSEYLYNENGDLNEDRSTSDDFEYKEYTQALYLNLKKKIGNLDLQIGLRGEHTQTKGVSLTYSETNQNNYFQLFPTFYLSYKTSSSNSLLFSYGRRITRPGYWALNPFRLYTNLYSYFEGNPFLKPSYSNNLELSYFYSNNLSTKIYANIQNNGFGQITIPDEQTRISRTTRQNYFNQNGYGIAQTLNSTGLDWLESYNQIQVYYMKLNPIIPNFEELDSFGASISTDNTIYFDAKKNILGNVSIFYSFPQMYLQNHNKAYYSIDLGGKYLCFDKRFAIGINATDIFKTAGFRFYSLINQIRTDYDNYFDTRSLRVSISYKFSGKSLKIRADKRDKTERNRAY